MITIEISKEKAIRDLGIYYESLMKGDLGGVTVVILPDDPKMVATVRRPDRTVSEVLNEMAGKFDSWERRKIMETAGIWWKSGDKIGAIKYLKTIPNLALGLKEAKELVEHWADSDWV